MKIEIATPTKAFIEASPDELSRLTKQLSYTNTSASQQIKRHYDNVWLRRKDKEAWEKKLLELKDDIHHTLVFDENGRKYIRPGSIPYLKAIDIDSVVNKIVYPTPKAVAWEKPLPFTLHPYQETSWSESIKQCAALGIPTNMELCTGAGKSAILIKASRELGMPAAIVAPSRDIFKELLEKFEFHFGRSKVGAFGDQKHRLGKLFTVCIADSLANVKPGTEEWEFFSNLKAFLADESHTWGAETLEAVDHGVFADVPYRIYASGTQTRNDGAEKLLQSIIGKTICTLPTHEAVEKGYICAHDYRIIELESSDPNTVSDNPLEMKRIHFLGNKNIREFIARLANVEATARRRQTLVLVEELHQISSLLKLLKVPVAIAHSSKDKKSLEKLGLPVVDPRESVKLFNQNQVSVLIGTSCISTGTNIYPTHNTVNWQGGASEIKTKQGAIGRSVRLHDQNPWKDQCAYKDKSTIYDFDVYDINKMHQHLLLREGWYKESRSEIKRIRIRK